MLGKPQPLKVVPLLIPRLGDIAHRLPIEDGLRSSAGLVRPQVGASVAVLEIALQPDEPSIAVAADWMASQELAVVFCLELGRYSGQRRLLETLSARCPRRIVVVMGDPADEVFAGPGASVLMTFGFQGCQLTAALRTIFARGASSGKRL